MALTVSMQLTNPSGFVVVGAQNFATVTMALASTDAAVTINSIAVSESTESDAQIQQPVFYAPNQPIGVGNPVIAAGGTLVVPFMFTINSPCSAGPSPQNAPGGAAGQPGAFPADAVFMFTAVVATAAGAIATGTLQVTALSTIPPFPKAQGGGFQHDQGANAVNFLTSFY